MKNTIVVIILLLAPLALLAQWEPDVRLTNNSAASLTSYNNAWCVTSSGSNVHLVWFDERDGNQEIYYKYSTDNGTNWSTDTRLTNNTGISGYPSIAVSGSNIHVVWMDTRDGNYEIYYKRSLDNGINWETDIRFTDNTAYSEYPSIAASGSLVYVVWQDYCDGNYEIYYKYSTNNGTNWSANIRLTDNIAYSQFPSITASGSNVHLVWYDYRDGNYEIYYKRSTDYGVNWSVDTRLTNIPAYSWHPSLAISGSNIHLVWSDNSDGNYEIYYKRSLDNGINWESDTRLTNNTAYSQSPSLAVSGTNIRLVWYDNRDGNQEIYYKQSLDNGTNWSADTRLTNNNANSWFPSVATIGSNVYVVWMDSRDANFEIYYKRNPTGNAIEENRLSNFTDRSSLEIFPNPARSFFTIRLRHDEVRSLLKLFDVTGKIVKSEELKGKDCRISLNSIKNGIYFVKVNDEMVKEKLVVTK